MTRRSLLWALALGLCSVGCAGSSIGVGVYPRYYPGYYYGRGPFWGYGRDTVVVVPPDCSGEECGGGGVPPEIDPPIAVPLPEPPPVEAFPDVGMPGDFGADLRFDFIGIMNQGVAVTALQWAPRQHAGGKNGIEVVLITHQPVNLVFFFHAETEVDQSDFFS